MTTPIPGAPTVDFTITYGADLDHRIARRDKTTGTPMPWPTGTTATVRVGGKAAKYTGPCDVDGDAVILHIESAALDLLGDETPYQLLVSAPGAGADPAALLVGRLVR